MNIYKITNLTNNLIYIGQEKSYNPDYFGSGILIKEAIKILGKHNFKKEIIEYCNCPKDLNTREIFWIRELNARDRDIGYNISPGGSLFPTSPEISKKISDSLKGKYIGVNAFRHGLKLTDEHKKIISEANKSKNKPISVETRDRMSKSRKGIEYSDKTKRMMSEAKIGVKLMDEHKKKISEGLVGHLVSEETKNKLKMGNINVKQKHSRSVDAIIMDEMKSYILIIFPNVLDILMLIGVK